MDLLTLISAALTQMMDDVGVPCLESRPSLLLMNTLVDGDLILYFYPRLT